MGVAFLVNLPAGAATAKGEAASNAGAYPGEDPLANSIATPAASNSVE